MVISRWLKVQTSAVRETEFLEITKRNRRWKVVEQVQGAPGSGKDAVGFGKTQAAKERARRVQLWGTVEVPEANFGSLSSIYQSNARQKV